MQKKLLRIIDANYNRAREGLRVCEDIFRFLFPASDMALRLKKVRRELAGIIGEFPVKELLSAREVEKDEIKFKLSGTESRDVQELLRRNFQRVTEALRVLEEVTSIFEARYKKKLMRLRFKVYKLEKDLLNIK